jgi:hypothetical protein
MDIGSAIVSILASLGVSIGTVHYLIKKLLEHRFDKDLKDHQQKLDVMTATAKHGFDQELTGIKAKFDEKLAITKAEVEAYAKKDVEEYLGERAAERQYRLEAKKRLYAAIGPLRVQLVMACSDFAGRIDRIGNGTQPYNTSLQGYFGKSTAFRLLRIFGISELIERQMAYADFSVEPSMVVLLHFKKAAFRCLTSSTISLKHQNENWNDQIEHIYYDRLSIIAAGIIVKENVGNAQRVMRFDEFDNFVSDTRNLHAIEPVPSLLNSFKIETKPILWLRFVALGQLCNTFVEQEGTQLGIIPEPFNGKNLILASRDDTLVKEVARYTHMLQGVASEILPTQG